MSSKEKRIRLSKWILETDENVLNEVEAIYNVKSRENDSSTDIIAYTISGEPLTKEMYIQKIKEAEKRIDEGNFTTHEDLLKEMQSW